MSKNENHDDVFDILREITKNAEKRNPVKKIHVLNPKKLKALGDAMKALTDLARECDPKSEIEYSVTHMDEFLAPVAQMEIITDLFYIDSIEKFVGALSTATHLEVIVKANGKALITIDFQSPYEVIEEQ